MEVKRPAVARGKNHVAKVLGDFKSVCCVGMRALAQPLGTEWSVETFSSRAGVTLHVLGLSFHQ